MINISDKVRNEIRVKGVVNKIEKFFNDQHFTSAKNLCREMNNGRVDIFLLRNQIFDFFEDEIDEYDMGLLNMYINNFYWVLKEFNNYLDAGKLIKCHYAMKMKNNLMDYVKDLALKYGGLK